ncbi:MAG: DegT/DnrJ/EryC1/StrS family aminotransferase, partial [Oscillospiraceae bacterium]|nr:DegT/DnrJ/EryC1/StrS family aminotransferase [Oscillospiraceae bacterium]
MHHKLTPSATKRLEGLEKLEERIFLSPPHQNGLEEAMVREALESNWLAPAGPHLAAFEQEICAEVGEGFLGAALSSGTAALHLALRVLGVGPGDVVFCSDLTFAGSVHPMLYEHATPVLIDCGADSCNMDPAALEKAFALYRPKAVIVVDLYGQSADWDAILPLCRAHGVPVIEDAAEALGAKYKGRPCGSFGDIGVFSFNGNKIITTSGGGMAVSRRADWIEKIRFLASQAKEPAPYYLHKELGFNYRMSNVCAGIGRAQLRTLGQRIARRKAICEGYTRAFAGLPLHLLPVPQGVTPNYWLSVIIL